MTDGIFPVRQEALADGSFELRTELRLDRPRDEVFAFFADAENLGRITPPWLRFRIATPTPIEMAPGTRIVYALRVRGIPTKWESVISVWEPGVRFVDEQVRGPYREWRHEHLFEDAPGGGTICRDEVRLRVPGGRWAWRLVVRPQLDEIFAHRQSVLVSLLS